MNYILKKQRRELCYKTLFANRLTPFSRGWKPLRQEGEERRIKDREEWSIVLRILLYAGFLFSPARMGNAVKKFK